MANFQRVPGKFAYAGMDLHHPPDLLPPDKCSFMFNLQPDLLSGALTTRPPIVPLATTPAGQAIHSLVRMNDSVPGVAIPFSRFAGAGANLYNAPNSPLTFLDSGFSGNPLAMVPYRPSQSPEPWLYVYDSLKQARYKTDGTIQQIGIAAPTVEAHLTRVQPLYGIIENAVSVGNWSGGTTSGGTTSAASLAARVAAGTTALAVLYDTGATGMASIAPFNATGDYSWMTASSMCTIGGEQVAIEQSFPTGYSTTIAAAAYDAGTTGVCTIVPSVPLPGLQRNMLLYLNSSVYARVLSVTAGPDASYSFRCSTGGATVAAGQLIVAPPSFRAWTTASHAVGVAIAGNSIKFTFTPTVMNGAMQDIVATNPTLAAPLNLSNASARPLQNEDYIHLSLNFDQPQYITEIHVMLAMNATTLFSDDYFYYVLRPGDFQTSITGANTVTTEQATLQSQLDALSSQISSQGVGQGIGENVAQAPYPSPEIPSTSAPQTSQLGLASGTAWTEAMFKIADMTRVGSNPAVSLANVVKLGIYVFVDGGVVSMTFGGWWAGGGYGPDCNFNSYGNQAPPLQWRYRYRNSLTGAHSTVSPETRNGEILRRQAVNLTCPNSPDPQVDTVDWERRGGTNPDWHQVLSVPQSGTGHTTALDNITENAAQIADPLEVTSYQPWPVTDVPHTGTALVTGTQVVWQSGDQFNPRWLRGTEIIIAGNTYSLFAPPVSATVLQLAQSVVPPSGVYAFSIPEATIEGQPVYGCWLDEANNRLMGVGDPLNPGLLYFSNTDNPDGASDAGYLEVASPSEPLLNGFYAEGSNYVFTSSSLYRVESTPGAANLYASYRLSGVEGMAGAWAFDAQRRIVFYWGPDGIYAYAFGPAADNLTAQDWFPLFPHEGQQGRQAIPGVPVSIAGQTIYPPNYALAPQLRIGYSESFVYATYQNSNGATEALVYSLASKGWRKDLYTPQVSLFALEKGIPNPLLMAGGVDGNLYTIGPSGDADAGGRIDWACLTPVHDAQDSRAAKQWGDLLLDYSGCFKCQVLWDNLLVSGASAIVPPFADRTHFIFDLFVPPDTLDIPLIHYNMALMLTGVGCPVYLYEWQPSYLPLPEDTTSRVSSWQTGGSGKFKWINGVVIHADTYGQNKVINIEYDNQQETIALTVNHNGEQRLPYYFPPVYGHELRLVPVDDVPWHAWEDEEWLGNDEPEYGGALAVNWVNGGAVDFKWVNGLELHADTYDNVKYIQVQFDGALNPVTGQQYYAVPVTIPIQHNGEQTRAYYFAPVYCHQMRILPLDSVVWRYWPDSRWIFNAEPDYGGQMAVNWHNGGTMRYKFTQGIRLHADTFGQSKQVQILYDGGIVGPVVTILHNGEQTVPYTWNPPFKARLYKIVPLDNVPWRYWPDSQWVYEPEPDPGNYWISQPTALGQSGFLHAREIWIPFATPTSGAVVSAIVDGAAPVSLAVLPASASPSKQYFVCPPLKGRYWQLTASGTGLQIYENDVEFSVKSWGATGPYSRVRPFGDTSGGAGGSGARI